MDTTSSTAVPSTGIIRAEEEATAETQQLEDRLQALKQAVMAFSSLKNCDVIVSQRRTFVNVLNTTYYFNNSVNFCAQDTKDQVRSITRLHSARTLDKTGTQVALP